MMDNTQSRSHLDYRCRGISISKVGRRGGHQWTTIEDRVVGNVRVLDKKCTTMNDLWYLSCAGPLSKILSSN